MKPSTTQTKAEIEHSAESAVRLIAEAVGKATGAIASAATEASKLIASNALDASKVVASNAAEALKVSSVKVNEDHDLLIRVDTKMTDLKLAVDKLSARDDVYVEKEDFLKVTSDHEARIRALEQQRWLWAGALVVILFLSPIAFNFISNLIKAK